MTRDLGQGCPLVIVCDTREQRPYDFVRFPGAEVKCGTLGTGDYSLEGHEERVSIERKELSDLLGCLTHDRPRFLREFERTAGLEFFALVVEATWGTLARGEYRSRMNPTAAVQSLLSMSVRFRLPVYCAGSREGGEATTYHLLRHYAREIDRRAKVAA